MKIFELYRERFRKAGYSFSFGGVIRYMNVCPTIKGIVIHVNNSPFPNPAGAYSLSITSSKVQFKIMVFSICSSLLMINFFSPINDID